MARHNSIGTLGERISAKWLEEKGFLIFERNYRKKWGEIDIVARGTDGIIRFVEVKTVSYGTTDLLNRAVSHGTWRPEEKIHTAKQSRFSRAIETWLLEHNVTEPWQIDVLILRVVPRERYCRVLHLENVIFNER